MKINCLVVDDEQLARDMLGAYVERFDKLHLVQKCKSAREAAEALAKDSVDLIFLDIQMPRQTGIEFLRTLKTRHPAVIFTTAYPNYALEGYELDIVDYLLKPISFKRFGEAVEKALRRLKNTGAEEEPKPDAEEFSEQFLMIHSEHNHHKIFLKDILYIESLKEYVQYHTTRGRILEHKTLKSLEESLPTDRFMRIHRSYIISIDQVQSYKNGKLILKNPSELPVGKTYKKQVIARLFKT